MKKTVYFDYAATTPIRPEVLAEVTASLAENYGNPSSVHEMGRKAKNALDLARIKIAACINATAAEIFFTSGGTEADNWAIKGVARANAYKGKHIIVTSIEHHAILHACDALTKEGFKITFLPIDQSGIVKIEDLLNAIRKDTILVSVMMANNEVGTIQPIEEIGKICRENGIVFHTDAVQAASLLSIDVERQNIDLCSLSAHKLYAPKGVGCLYIKRGIKIKNLLDGGAQERTKRAGTENLPAIVGFAEGLKLAVAEQEEEVGRLKKLQDLLISGIEDNIPSAILCGSRVNRLANNINFTFEDVDGEAMLLMLDSFGYCCSAGSACTSGSLEASHVLLAMGIDKNLAASSLRLTLGKNTTEDEILAFIPILTGIVKQLRNVKMH